MEPNHPRHHFLSRGRRFVLVRTNPTQSTFATGYDFASLQPSSSALPNVFEIPAGYMVAEVADYSSITMLEPGQGVGPQQGFLREDMHNVLDHVCDQVLGRPFGPPLRRSNSFGPGSPVPRPALMAEYADTAGQEREYVVSRKYGKGSTHQRRNSFGSCSPRRRTAQLASANDSNVSFDLFPAATSSTEASRQADQQMASQTLPPILASDPQTAKEGTPYFAFCMPTAEHSTDAGKETLPFSPQEPAASASQSFPQNTGGKEVYVRNDLITPALGFTSVNLAKQVARRHYGECMAVSQTKKPNLNAKEPRYGLKLRCNRKCTSDECKCGCKDVCKRNRCSFIVWIKADVCTADDEHNGELRNISIWHNEDPLKQQHLCLGFDRENCFLKYGLPEWVKSFISSGDMYERTVGETQDRLLVHIRGQLKDWERDIIKAVSPAEKELAICERNEWRMRCKDVLVDGDEDGILTREVCQQIEYHMKNKKKSEKDNEGALDSIKTVQDLKDFMSSNELKPPAGYVPRSDFQSADDVAKALGMRPDERRYACYHAEIEKILSQDHTLFSSASELAERLKALDTATFMLSPTMIYLLQETLKQPDAKVFVSGDGTHVLLNDGSVVLLFGPHDLRYRPNSQTVTSQFRPIIMATAGSENKFLIAATLLVLKLVARDFLGLEFVVDFAESDNSAAFRGAYRAIFGAAFVWLMCYFHVTQAAGKLNKSKAVAKKFTGGGDKGKKKEHQDLYLTMVQKAHECKTPAQFKAADERLQAVLHSFGEEGALELHRKEYSSASLPGPLGKAGERGNWFCGASGVPGIIPSGIPNENYNNYGVKRVMRKNVSISRFHTTETVKFFRKHAFLGREFGRARPLDEGQVPPESIAAALFMNHELDLVERDELSGMIAWHMPVINEEQHTRMFLANSGKFVGVPIDDGRVERYRLACLGLIEPFLPTDGEEKEPERSRHALNSLVLAGKQFCRITAVFKGNELVTAIGDCMHCYKYLHCPGLISLYDRFGRFPLSRRVQVLPRGVGRPSQASRARDKVEAVVERFMPHDVDAFVKAIRSVQRQNDMLELLGIPSKDGVCEANAIRAILAERGKKQGGGKDTSEEGTASQIRKMEDRTPPRVSCTAATKRRKSAQGTSS